MSDLPEGVSHGDQDHWDGQSYYEAVAPKVGLEPEDSTWEGVFAAEVMGWGLKTPVGIVPFGLTHPEEVVDFTESLAKPWPKEDPRRD